MTLLTPQATGRKYVAIVEHPEGFAPIRDAHGRLVATSGNQGQEFTLPYRVANGAEAGVDHWDTGILFTGLYPREVEIAAVTSGNEHVKDRPTVADGGGAGSGTEEVASNKPIGPYSANVITTVIVPYTPPRPLAGPEEDPAKPGPKTPK
ncbi:MAG: hypothetical protein RBT71_09285 [Flavobacteriales bacterium]|nr:hypothetical protein [Flavobacteriales bacterium]